MADYSEVKGKIREFIKPNGKGEITASQMQEILLQVVSDTDTKKQDKEQGKGLSTNDFTDAYKTAIDTMPETLGNLSTEIEKKAEQDGKYPQLTSGFANNLVGRGESTESEFSFRASGGKSIEDGTARISELRGNGVVWNQLAKKGLSQNGIEGWCFHENNISGLNYDAVKNEYSFTCNGAKRLYTRIDFLNTHKYLVAFDIELQTTNTYSNNVYVGYLEGATQWLMNAVSISEFINKRKSIATIVTANSDKSMLYLGLYQDALTPDDTQIISKPIVHDLTLMFGAGNEPTTVEEFYARKPIGVDEYAYNEGTLIPFNAEGVKSVGFNAWDGAMEEGIASDINGTIVKVQNSLCTDFVRILPNNDYFIRTDATSGRWGAWYDSNKQYISGIAGDGIKTSPANAVYMRMTIVENGNGNPDTFCINLSHTGYRNGEHQPYEDFVREIDPRIKEAFPNGMKPCDKVYNKNGKGYIVKGSGSVDLGTLNYTKMTTYDIPAYYTKITDSVIPTTWQEVSNVICSRFAAGTGHESVGKGGVINRIAITPQSNISIAPATTYANELEFKTAMQGVMLWYELAEPEVIEYDEPFNLDYEVWDFGTEEILSEHPSAPISADIIYQFNAVDTIRNNQIEIAELKAMIATMQAQMASLTSQTNLEE